jgi:hypothetical protein
MGGANKLVNFFGVEIDLINALCSTFGNNFLGNTIGALFGNPNGPGPDEKCMKDTSGGSGPFKARYIEASSLVNHTIYAPANPTNEKLPVLIWSNGFCLQVGLMFANFHQEIASHGFMVISNGPIKPDLGGLDSYKDLINAIDWVTTSPDVKKFGDVDTEKIAVGGQSCGGIQAVRISQCLCNLTLIVGCSQRSQS